MPQEFHVIQCYSCQTFQVHQVKKTTKWVCKMCGEKQSLKKVYGKGTGAECRQHVQRLNTLRAELDQKSDRTSLYERTDLQINKHNRADPGNESFHNNDDTEVFPQQNKVISRWIGGVRPYSIETKWNKFVERNSNIDDDDDHSDRFTTDVHTFKLAGKRKRVHNQGGLGLEPRNKWGKFTTSIDEEYPNAYLNFVDDSTVDSPFEKCENKVMFSSSDKGNRNYSLDTCNNTCEINNTSQGYKSSFMVRDTTKSSCAVNISDSIDLPSSTVTNKVQSNEKNVNIGTQVKSKWGMFAEEDVSTQESNTDSFQRQDEELYDTRPYVTFDPEELINLSEPAPVNAENENNLSEAMQYDSSTKADVNVNRFEGMLVNNSSKWASFLAKRDAVDNSGIPTDTSNNSRYKTFSDRVCNLENDENVIFGENIENSIIAEKENKPLFRKTDNTYKHRSEANSEVRQNLERDNLIYQTADRKYNSNFVKSNKFDKKEHLAQVFTAGDLDEEDFEL